MFTGFTNIHYFSSTPTLCKDILEKSLDTVDTVIATYHHHHPLPLPNQTIPPIHTITNQTISFTFLPITSCLLPIDNYKLPITNCQVKIANYKLPKHLNLISNLHSCSPNVGSQRVNDKILVLRLLILRLFSETKMRY